PLPLLSHNTAPPPTSALSLHDALPISTGRRRGGTRLLPTGVRPRIIDRAFSLGVVAPDVQRLFPPNRTAAALKPRRSTPAAEGRSEEHTSELQSRGHLVCRLLLEKKKK